jgi:hypothetical protein
MELLGADRERTDEMGRCDSGCSYEEHLVILEEVSCLYIIRIYDFSMSSDPRPAPKTKTDVFITVSPAFFLLCALRFCLQIRPGVGSVSAITGPQLAFQPCRDGSYGKERILGNIWSDILGVAA